MKMKLAMFDVKHLDNFMEVLKKIDEYLESLPLKRNIDLKIKVEVETRHGVILKFERWLTDLVEDD